jgi:hypothetical protein
MQENKWFSLQIQQVVQYLETLGVQIHPSSRLHQYATLFEGHDDHLAIALDLALLEVLQFLTIARSLSTLSDISNWIPSLKSATTGHTDCRFDNGRARSDQFELYTMSCLSSAGFHVIPAEPDLRSKIAGIDVAFAAKRLRSEAKLVRNLTDAQRQLARQRIPGYIVLDLSFVNLFAKPLYVRRLEHQQLIAHIFVDAFAKTHEHALMNAATQPYVLGVLLHGSAVGRSLEPHARFVSRRWLLCARSHSLISSRLLNAIQEAGRGSWTRA